MIVRILHEGQYDVEGDAIEELERIDDELVQRIHARDEAGFRREFASALKLVRQRGEPVPHERLVGSDLVLPAADTTLAEASRLLLHEEA